ncbi:MAG TPA: hypothetical protein DCM07_08255 [Planctomycetaceae bacterium]|nr:hypothetical protein [Planctomycetaceae bacterium]
MPGKITGRSCPRVGNEAGLLYLGSGADERSQKAFLPYPVNRAADTERNHSVIELFLISRIRALFS